MQQKRLQIVSITISQTTWEKNHPKCPIKKLDVKIHRRNKNYQQRNQKSIVLVIKKLIIV